MSILEKFKDTVSYYAENGVDLTYVDSETSAKRFRICKGCEFYQSLTTQCEKCGCFMFFKTKLMYDPVESGASLKKVLTECADKRAVVTQNINGNKYLFYTEGEGTKMRNYTAENVQKFAFGNKDAAAEFIEKYKLDGSHVELLKKW
jgi:hypothetical protein